MNIKKIAITAAAAGVMLSAAIPALANGGHRRGGDLEIKIENKDTTVTNRVLTVANTGLNQTNGGDGESVSLGGWGHHNNGGDIDTGNAGAETDILNVVNSNTVDLCDCLGNRRGDVKIEIENKNTDVTNRVLTVANTGLNQVNGSGDIDTGNAGAGTWITNIVNTNVVN